MKRIVFFGSILLGLTLTLQQASSQSLKSLRDKATNAAKNVNKSEQSNKSQTASTASVGKVNIIKPENIKRENILIAFGKPVYGQAQGSIFRSTDNENTW